jgi:hypothetical protein
LLTQLTQALERVRALLEVERRRYLRHRDREPIRTKPGPGDVCSLT